MIMQPDLIVSHVKVPENTYIFNLKRYLYFGGANADARWGASEIERGEMGLPQPERLELLLEIKEFIELRFTLGDAYASVISYLTTLNKFFQFIDQNRAHCSLNNLESNYLDYSEYIFREIHKKPSSINEATGYSYASKLSNIFGQILDIPQGASLISRTRLRFKKTVKKAISKTEEKQNLEDTFRLGHFLVDLNDGLTVESILGELPLRIIMREGLVENNEVVFVQRADEWLTKPIEEWTFYQQITSKRSKSIRQPVNSTEGNARWIFVNLRVTAEFFVFIAQTGMNVSQAQNLKSEHFKYKLMGDSWEVRSFKPRREGEVRFRIYKSYKPFLEKYLTFINHFFPNSQWLFPVFSGKGENYSSKHIKHYKCLKSVITNFKIPWIPPRTLRSTKVNWLLRRSGDEDIAAEIAQHSKEVLREHYERPSQQLAMIEITQFWNKHDLIKRGDLVGSLIASHCNGKPESINSKPISVVEPNCISPSGCLWCKHLRDSDSEDYVWSLASMRHLKSIEASAAIVQKIVPADIVIDRLSAKINWFQTSSEIRANWVEEAARRIEEGYFHPSWSKIIEFLE